MRLGLAPPGCLLAPSPLAGEGWGEGVNARRPLTRYRPALSGRASGQGRDVGGGGAGSGRERVGIVTGMTSNEHT